MAFKQGQSGNPLGRPKGVKDRRTVFRELIEPSHSKLAQKAIDMALEGNEQMLKLLLDRLLPPKPREEIVDICLVSDNLVENSKTIMQQLANGGITVLEANTLMRTVAMESRIYEIEKLTRDVAALEEIVRNQGHRV